MAESIDDRSIFSIDVARLTEELEKFEKMTKECEDSDGATEALMEGTSIEFSDSPSFLDKYLLMVSKTGNPLVQWSKISFFIRHKIDAILTTFYMKYGIEDVDSPNLPPFNYIASKERLLQHFDTFTGAPFTIQRLCEILIDPTRHYKRTDKLLRGLEKNILVVSTIGRLSEDCSDPQQRSSLFNGLQLSFRTYRPPLPDSIDKFPDSVDDVEMKDGGNQQLNGVDPELLDEDEASFDRECLPIKHDMEEEDLDELEEQDVRPRLMDAGASHPALGAFSLASVNSVISIRRKRKEDERMDDEEPMEEGGSPKRIKTDDEEEKDDKMIVEEDKENCGAQEKPANTDEPVKADQSVEEAEEQKAEEPAHSVAKRESPEKSKEEQMDVESIAHSPVKETEETDVPKQEEAKKEPCENTPTKTAEVAKPAESEEDTKPKESINSTNFDNSDTQQRKEDEAVTSSLTVEATEINSPAEDSKELEEKPEPPSEKEEACDPPSVIKETAAAEAENATEGDIVESDGNEQPPAPDKTQSEKEPQESFVAESDATDTKEESKESDEKVKEESDEKVEEESDEKAKEESDEKVEEESDEKVEEESDEKAEEETNTTTTNDSQTTSAQEKSEADKEDK